MTDAPISSQRLKSFIERVEKLVEERKAIQSDIRDVFAEAKGVGYNVPIMRKVLALRALDAADRDEQMTLLDTYMHALETVDRVQARVAAGESVRAVGAAEGVSRMTALRLSQKSDNARNGTPHDPETGEINDTDGRSEPENGVPAPGDEARAAEPGPGEDGGGCAEAVRLRDGHEEGSGEGRQAQAPSPVITDAQALAAMDEAYERLQALKRERGLGA